MRIGIQKTPALSQIVRLGGVPSNILIQNTGGSQFAIVGATNGSGAVTYQSGKNFDTSWPAGTQVEIGGGVYTIQSVTSGTALVLAENFTGTTSTALGMVVLANAYISDSAPQLQSPTVGGVPQTGLIIAVDGSLSLQNWTADLFAVSDTAAIELEIIVTTIGGAAVSNPSGRSAVSGGSSSSSSSGGTSFGGSGGGGGVAPKSGKGGSTF